MGFLNGILSIFGAGNDPESRKKRLLKQIAQDIHRSKYRKFYKPNTGEMTSLMAKFFFDMYKTLVIAQTIMKSADKSAILKQVTVETYMSKELREIYDNLSPESIENQAKSIPPKELSHKLQGDLNIFSSALSIDDINEIDRIYTLIIMFASFLSFDFFGLLKKIDPRIKEQDIKYQLHIRNVSGRYILEDIKEFLYLSKLDASVEDWKMVFEVLKRYKPGTTIIEYGQWKKVLASINEMHKSGFLVLMVRHISQNPNWQTDYHVEYLQIVEDFLKMKKKEVHECIDKIINDKLTLKREALAKQLFNTAEVTRLQNYTNGNNEFFLKKGLEGYTCIEALNYIKAFVIDYPDVRELCDLFLIRGQWVSQELSHQISTGLHEISDLYEQLLTFDEGLGEKGANGMKLRTQFVKAKSDGQFTHIKITLGVINDEAYEMIHKASSAFSLVGDYLKELYHDYKKNYPALLVNWKEVESVSTPSIKERMEANTKVIEDFVNLMELYMTNEI